MGGLLVLQVEVQRLHKSGASMWVGIYIALCGVTQLMCPVLGKLSDSYASSFGRRRPFIAFGCVLSILGIAGLWVASLEILPTLYSLSLVVLEMGMNMTFAAQAAIPPDILADPDSSLNGFVSGLIGAQAFLGSLSSVAIIVVTHRMPIQVQYPIFMVLTFAASATVFFMAIDLPVKKVTPWTFKELLMTFTIDMSTDRDFFWICLGRWCYYMISSVSVFLYFYIRDMFNIHSDAKVRELLGIVMAVSLLTGGSVAIPSAQASNKFGRKRTIYLSAAVMILAMTTFLTVPFLGAEWLIYACAIVYGSGNGVYLSVDYALALDCMPKKKTPAESLGLWGVAGFLGTAVGPVFGGLLLNYCSYTIKGHQLYTYTGYVLVMTGAMVTALFLCVFTSRIKKKI